MEIWGSRLVRLRLEVDRGDYLLVEVRLCSRTITNNKKWGVMAWVPLKVNPRLKVE